MNSFFHVLKYSWLLIFVQLKNSLDNFDLKLVFFTILNLSVFTFVLPPELTPATKIKRKKIVLFLFNRVIINFKFNKIMINCLFYFFAECNMGIDYFDCILDHKNSITIEFFSIFLDEGILYLIWLFSILEKKCISPIDSYIRSTWCWTL